MNLPENNLSFLPKIKQFLSEKGTILIIYLISPIRENFEKNDKMMKSILEKNNLQVIEIKKRKIVKTYAPGKHTLVYDVLITG
jgi:tRNA G37 N-methylase Trm5